VPIKFAINEIINSNIALGGPSSNPDGQEQDEQEFDQNGYEIQRSDLPQCTLPIEIDDNDYFGDKFNFMNQDGTFNTDKY
jgi:hypothetical protein